jgi:hypothetical protein
LKGRTSRRGRFLRLIENLPPAPRAELLPASTSRAVIRAPAVGTSVATPFVVLPRQLVGNVPFLAQYLAQDADRQQAGERPSPERWRQRDAAYRLAALPAQSAEINLEI